MKLEHLPEYLTIVVTVTLGMLLAVYIGTSTGSGSNTPILIVGGILAVTVALLVKEKIWLLIPLFWPMIGQMSGLPGGIPVRDAVIAYVLLVFLALKALKIVRGKPKYGLLDYVLWANVAYIAALYVRYPAGFASMGTEYVGAKPYIDILFATFAYWIIRHFTISERLSRIFPILSLSGSFLAGFFNFITFHFPSTVPFIGRFYSGISVGAYDDPTSIDDDTQREQYLAPLGGDQVKLLCSYFSPITLFNPLHIFRFLGLALSVYFVLRSGHRSGLIACMAYIVIGSYLRYGFTSILRMALIGIPALACLIGFQGVLYDLPLPAQRTLSFLPGHWDPRASLEAKASTEWRVDMWKEVWSSNQYIKNWWFGDGFGFARKVLKEDAFEEGAGVSRGALMSSASYHSGFLSAIKASGYIGMTLFFVLMFWAAILAWKVTQKTKGTPFFSFGVFVSLYMIYFPFRFLFVFGTYKDDVGSMIYFIALLNLIDRSVKKWRAEQGKDEAVEQDFPNPIVDSRPTLLGAPLRRLGSMNFGKRGTENDAR